MELLEPWRRGDRTTSPLLQLVWGLLGRAADVALLAFVGSTCAPVAALAPPSMCAMVGDVVRLPQAVRRKDWYRGVPPRRGRFALSLLNHLGFKQRPPVKGVHSQHTKTRRMHGNNHVTLIYVKR